MLLGGTGEEACRLESLSAGERGLLSYLFLSIMGFLDEVWTSAAGLQPCFRGFVDRPAGLDGFTVGDWSVLPVGVRAGPARGALRLFIPYSCIRDLKARSKGPVPGPRALELLRSIPAPGAVEIGCAELAALEIEGLEPGDVLILDQRYASYGTEGWSGAARIRFGPHSNKRVTAKLASTPQGASLRIQGLGARWSSVEENAMSKVDQEKEAAALLEAVPVTLQAEIGRIELTAAEVAQLRVGQLLMLDRKIDDPVRITASGNTIAHGEPVEVEGQFGIRILEI